MRTPIVILLFATVLVGCRVRQAGAPASSTVTLAGSYYRGDHTGYNIYLDMLADGSYSAKWRGCLGEYGMAYGTWARADDRVVFSPSQETGMMKGHLRELHMVRHKGQTVFVLDLQDDYYREYGPDEYAAFHKQRRE